MSYETRKRILTRLGIAAALRPVAPAEDLRVSETPYRLSFRGDRMTRVDQSALKKKIAHLRSFAAADAPADELERSRSALAKVVTRIRKSKALQAGD